MEPAAIFGPLAADYAATRPSYPSELFDAIWQRLEILPPRAADVAAGSGIATEALIARGAWTVAIEPARAMAGHASDRLAGRAGWLGVLAARAEALPISPGALDLATVAQAFHWFDSESALGEIAAALKPGGILAVFWNVTVEDAFSRAVVELIVRYNPDCNPPVSVAMRETPLVLIEHPAFVVEPPIAFLHTRRLPLDRYLLYARSWSYVGGALSTSQLAEFEQELQTLFVAHHGDGEREERLSAVLHLARRT